MCFPFLNITEEASFASYEGMEQNYVLRSVGVCERNPLCLLFPSTLLVRQPQKYLSPNHL